MNNCRAPIETTVKAMNRDRLYFLFLNIGHLLDHLFVLIFATVAALVLYREWGIAYGELLVYATPGFFAFGAFALPAGWLADRWSKDGMMCVFFIGIGLVSIATGFSDTPLEIGTGLFAIGVFAAIYHPVGLAIITLRWHNTGVRIAANGVWGNLGVAVAALITGYLIDHASWRMAFIVPGLFSIAMGVAFLALRWESIGPRPAAEKADAGGLRSIPSPQYKALLIRVSAIIFLTTALSAIIYQSTTFALPKIIEERAPGLASDMAAWAGNAAAKTDGDVATMIGSLAFMIFAVASIAQLVVGTLLDRYGPRRVFIAAAVLQLVFFSSMPGLTEGLALIATLGFMLGAFGQIPITNFMIGKTASGPYRARIYGVRYVVSFSALAATLPLIGVVYHNWGFNTLFYILATAAFVILVAVAVLPGKLPVPESAGAAAE